ncbi:MAG: transcriptional regulator [Dechloromonas sp.]|nr:transcriptional regulator [Candidatus Dechloromonas phosphoritropha]
MDEEAEFAERLKQTMLAAGYEPRPSVIEREFNQRYWGRSISFRPRGKWLLGKAVPQQDKLQILADWLKIEPQILRFGGEAIRSVQEEKALGRSRHRTRARGTGGLRQPPAPQKKVAREVILALAKVGS